MKKLVIALALVLGCASGVWGKSEQPDYPTTGNLYGLVDNGSRYESIFYICIPNGRKIDCTFKSHCIRFPDKSRTPIQDNYNKLSTKAKEETRNAYKKRCDYKKNIKSEELAEILNGNDYSKEETNAFDKMCKNNINVEEYIKSIDDLKNKVCRVTTANWECSFEKNIDGNWECSHIGELFGGIVGVKKATVQTFYPVKGLPRRYDYTFEYSYIGTPKDGKPLEGGKDSYSWTEESPVKLPCDYVSLNFF
jgi:hypothetical protein